jgi:uncharacterized protein YodC (DUF2158 family)
MEELIKVGDVVVINSGGPRMTVTNVSVDEDDGTVSIGIMWMTERGYDSTEIPLACVTKV